MNRTKAIIALTASLMSTVALSNSAYASQQKSYPGSTCDAPNGTQAAYLSKTDQGSVLNTSASNTILFLNCSIVRENVNSSQPAPSAYIRIKNTQNVKTTCWFEAFDSNGGYHDIKSDNFTGVGTKTIVLNLSKLTRGGDPYQIQCSLPPGSSILQYLIVERP
ncbi:MAG: hypothetical protein KME17_31500 [Cyanosarcina radialis HA8281-LM2]|jgi:hypothetical protein|nr:hypothetical protein [Cyanosarcina radialis HA8281-LM2]